MATPAWSASTRRTGDRLWSHDDLRPSGALLSLGSPSSSHVLPVDNRDGTLFGMRVRDGTTVWEKKRREIAWQRRPNANGIVGTTDDTAFVANAGLPPLVDAASVPRFEAWDLETGKVRWTRVLDPGTYPTAIATDGTDLFISTWQDPDPASADVPGSVLQIEAADGTVTTVAAAFRVPRGLAYTAAGGHTRHDLDQHTRQRATRPPRASRHPPTFPEASCRSRLPTARSQRSPLRSGCPEGWPTPRGGHTRHDLDQHTGNAARPPRASRHLGSSHRRGPLTRESTLRYAVDALLFAQDDSFRPHHCSRSKQPQDASSGSDHRISLPRP